MRTLMTNNTTVVLVVVAIPALVSLIFVRRLLRPLGGEPEVMAGIANSIAQVNLDVQLSDTGKESGMYLALENMAKLSPIEMSEGFTPTVSTSCRSKARIICGAVFM